MSQDGLALPADDRRPTPAVLLRLEPTPQQPIAYGRYVLLARIAEGGMGEIFVASSPERRDGSLLAIKRLHPHLAPDPRARQRFEEEARLTAALAHPQVVAIHEHDVDETGVPFLAMEFLPGATLKGLVRTSLTRHGQMPPIPFSVWIVSRACRALHHAHTVGVDGSPVIHGDVSPENLLVTYAGQVKLLDFGVARTEDRTESPAAAAGFVRGKLSYLPPELVHGEPVGPASDQFALGVVLHELLTGKRAYRHHSTLDELRAAMTRPLTPPRQLNPSLPEELDRIVRQACALRPADRFPDCRGFATALERWLAETGTPFDEEAASRTMQELFAPEFLDYREWLRQTLGLPQLFPKEPHGGFTPIHGRRATTIPRTALGQTGEFADEDTDLSIRFHPPRPGRGRDLALAGLLLLFLALALLTVRLTDRPPATTGRPRAVPVAPVSAAPTVPGAARLQGEVPALQVPARPVPADAPAPPPPVPDDALDTPPPVPADAPDTPLPVPADDRARPPSPTPASASLPAPPASPPETLGPPPGLLLLTVTPSQPVTVWDDQTLLGTPPLEKSLSPGRHQLEVRDPTGRLLQAFSLAIDSDATLVHEVQLPPPTPASPQP
ncbi:MAG: serine/threonine-protein kinase [Myxococcota bacterium]|jgi:hypothetical protein|nr:serine/threonine-protein kinase [Myxococcota bacterium]